MGICNLLKCIFRPEKGAIKLPTPPCSSACLQAGFLFQGGRTSNGKNSLAGSSLEGGRKTQTRAALVRAAPARPVQRRDKVQCCVVSQPGSRWGLPLFTLGEDGGVQGRKGVTPPCAANCLTPRCSPVPNDLRSCWMGSGFRGCELQEQVGLLGKDSRPGTKQKEKSVLFPGW